MTTKMLVNTAMKIFLFVRCMACVFIFFALLLGGCTAQAQTDSPAPLVTLLKTPNAGIQPQAALDDKGTLHLIYFGGKPSAGDIFYVQRKAGAENFSTPIRVNSQPNNAIATGTIRGAQIAIGTNHRVHVAWNGSSKAQPKGAGGTPMLYARLNDAGTAFEPQRNLITWAGGLDGGGTIASDDTGRVYVAWHAEPADKDEAQRAVYLARSSDDGATFAREKRINPDSTGACGCCQMRAFVDSKGTLSILYRAAGDNVNRDSMLLASNDAGENFHSRKLDEWNIAACPMSSYALAQSSDQLLASWQTEEQVYFADVSEKTLKKTAAPGEGKARKHSTLAVGADSKTLFAWTEGTGWNRGGALAWQIYDKSGRTTGEKGRANGVPVWGLLSAVARPDGGFWLFY